MSPPPLVDRAIIDDLFEQIGTDAVRSILALFVGEANTYRATIAEAAAQASDAASRERARRAAHSLKSGAGQIGATSLYTAAAAVEQAAAEGARELARAAEALERCAAETMEALCPFLA
jgi:HPt (histidine-containing phosphotransfer) domain-containing protein